MPLTEIALKNARPTAKPYKIADASGLFVLVNPNGSRLWRLKYRFAGKEKLLTFGAYPEVSLKQARDLRDAAKRLLVDGKDPSVERKTAKRAARLAAENDFETIAREFVQKQGAR